MTEKKPLRKGQGRRQFIACLARIKELLNQGYDIRMTYEALREDGLITMSYGGFYDLVTQRKRLKKKQVRNEEPAPGLIFTLEPAIAPTLPPEPLVLLKHHEDASPNDKAERRKAVQESLRNGLKANEDFLNDSSPDSEFEQEKNRLV